MQDVFWPETCMMRAGQGANLDIRCGRATLREYLAQAFPSLRPETIAVTRPPNLLQGLKAGGGLLSLVGHFCLYVQLLVFVLLLQSCTCQLMIGFLQIFTGFAEKI